MNLANLKKGRLASKDVWACAASLWALSMLAASAATYYVSPQGDDGNPGTREAPWRSAGHAGKTARAGDTVLFLPGDYRDLLNPAHSGAPGSPVVFRSKYPRKARLIGGDEGDWREGHGGRFRLTDVSHITLEGFHIEDDSPDSSTGGWGWIDKSSHIVIRNCFFTGGYRFVHFFIKNSEQIRVLDSDFDRNRDGGDVWRNQNVNGMLIEGNSFTRALHTQMSVGTSRNIVARGNVFHSDWSRNFSNRDNDRYLVENNIFTNAYNGSRSAGSTNQFTGNRYIIRFNQTFRNFGPPWVMAASSRIDTRHNRVYNNVFHGNHGPGWVANSNRGNFRDLILLNNIFADNDPFGSQTQLGVNGGGAQSVIVRNNGFHVSDEPAAPAALIRYARQPLSLDPGRENSWTVDVASPALTVTRSAGEGRHLPVEEEFHFLRPTENGAEVNDLIYVGDVENRARMLGVNGEARMLRLDRELSWAGDAPVGFLVEPRHLKVFQNNFSITPEFEGPGHFNFALGETSPLRGKGAPPTITRGAGEGREIPVNDVLYFL